MELHDVIKFVGENEGRWLPTIGGRAQFSARKAGNKAFLFTTQRNRPRNENYNHIGKSLKVYNETGSFKIQDYSHTRNASYVLGVFWQIVAQRDGIQGFAPELPVEEMEVLAAPKTEQTQLRKSRLGQGQYRTKLLTLRKVCYVTGVSDADFLRASHIKPWKDSNNVERLDPYNGLLLTPNCDFLFDAGFISFADDGAILISNELPQKILTMFQIAVNFRGVDLGDRTKQYLDFHRKNKFRG
jgi:predicted restriction endonuclease